MGLGGSGCIIDIPAGERKTLREIERSITTTYRKTLWTRFNQAINDYKLVSEGDKIAVAVSGGKDSMLMAKLFQELKRHGKVKFDLEFIAMDPGYHESNLQLLMSNCEFLNIPLVIFPSGIFEVVEKIANDYPCYMCAKMRRGALYSKAKELGCNKLALGHHFNDVIETTMLNLIYAGTFSTMRPKLKSQNFEGLELIRPLFYVHEEDIRRYTRSNGILSMNCGCIVAAQKTSSKRREVKELIQHIKGNFVDADKSIFNAAQNVNLDTLLAWKQDEKKYSFLDFYNDEE